MQKVIIDHDLVELYGVETKRLTEQVRRNIKRFPDDLQNASLNNQVQREIEEMEKKYDQQFKVVFDTIKALLQHPEPNKNPIVFLREERLRYGT
ncbi:MAG: ORF6N domain-containing protein [Elusimicrobiota bacterium]|nr:ORF6N domain-containing protein [Elusimicrobiota bacterium]